MDVLLSWVKMQKETPIPALCSGNV